MEGHRTLSDDYRVVALGDEDQGECSCGHLPNRGPLRYKLEGEDLISLRNIACVRQRCHGNRPAWPKGQDDWLPIPSASLRNTGPSCPAMEEQ